MSKMTKIGVWIECVGWFFADSPPFDSPSLEREGDRGESQGNVCVKILSSIFVIIILMFYTTVRTNLMDKKYVVVTLPIF
jgi:hypothetical protein